MRCHLLAQAKHNRATEKLLDGAKEATEVMLAKRVGRRTGSAANPQPSQDADGDASEMVAAGTASKQEPGLTEELEDGDNADGASDTVDTGDADSGATND